MGEQPALTVTILTEQEAATKKALRHAALDLEVDLRVLVWQILNTWAERQRYDLSTEEGLKTYMDSVIKKNSGVNEDI